jgi:hypothetical protein
MAKALITGASSGIGKDIAIELSKRGYELILVARNEEKLEEVKSQISTKVEIIPLDVSIKENCEQLHEKVGYVDILVNNAGFGVFGKFSQTSLEREIQLINTNVIAVHVLTKLFLKDMIDNGSGYILNVSSIAGHLPGPLMAAYYSSKNYVTTLSESINYELKKEKINVKIGTLNPGPVKTNFNNVANVKFDLHSLSSEYVAKYTVNKMLKGKTDITPGFTIKIVRFFGKIIPNNLLSIFVYKSQRRKNK